MTNGLQVALESRGTDLDDGRRVKLKLLSGSKHRYEQGRGYDLDTGQLMESIYVNCRGGKEGWEWQT